MFAEHSRQWRVSALRSWRRPRARSSPGRTSNRTSALLTRTPRPGIRRQDVGVFATIAGLPSEIQVQFADVAQGDNDRLAENVGAPGEPPYKERSKPESDSLGPTFWID
jgi:hypothetical protein